MAHASYYNPALDGTAAPVAGKGFLKALWVNFSSWLRRIETRRQLRNLPDYLLDDIGITRYEIENYKFHK